MIKSFFRPVSTIEWKIFLFNQVNFPIGQKCFPQKLKMGHNSPHIAPCLYNLYVNPTVYVNPQIVTVHAIYEDLPIVKLKSPLNNILSYFVENALVVLDY